MSPELLTMYQKIQESPALTIDFPEESGNGRIIRPDTNIFSISSWNMEFNRDTFVEGTVAKDLRLLFCSGDGVEWITNRGPMRLDHNEACFCLSDGSSEKMCYHGNSQFSFFSVSMPSDRFSRVIENYIPDSNGITDFLQGRRFTISAAIQKSLHEIGSLDSIHSGLEMMRLEAHLWENLSLCLQTVLCEPVNRRHLHEDDLQVIRALGKRIEENPAVIPDIATLAREYCMSISKLTRDFRQVYGVSLHAYVISARLQKGAELLLHDGIPIQEIAETVGYTKPSQFSADFKKRFGILPVEYRMCR